MGGTIALTLSSADTSKSTTLYLIFKQNLPYLVGAADDIKANICVCRMEHAPFALIALVATN